MDRPVRVLAYAGGRGGEAPRAVWLGTRRVAVRGVLARWLETGLERGTGVRRWFRVELATGQIMTLYHDEALDAWFAPEPPPDRGPRAAP